ncbi:N-acetylneuraminate synthase family protein [Rothia sp. ZJ932]|uniref:N-acetylneuraminate synthase family protein n=1 Tax=Rothia sp. ZJ932 TaxID=2810516 RepID=UPI001967052D|nr:N-acetylneuraminate synthase family protein [Rothia sp. ZJ932]QRZ61202.1 N-acetylneuraminate synthase family protein [Rothia sp. ZJ932]
MIIERNTTPYIVFSEDPVLTALQKISANGQRIIFLVNESGVLQGALSDGDFRRWLVANPTASLETKALEVANKNMRSAAFGSEPAELQKEFATGVSLLPLVDERGHLIAIAMDEQNVLRIGRHTITENSPSFIIAEIGNNHQGDVDLAKRLVDLAVETGADAVKFQLRDMDALYRQAGSKSAGEDLGVQYTLDLLRRFSFDVDQMYEVFDHVKQHDMDIMCTPWDGPSVQALVDYGVQGLKVASADLTNHELLRDMASRGLPMLISTGMSREEEIRESVNLIRLAGASYALLQCQSTYPAPFKDVNLAYMDRLAEIGQSLVGYSGHERGYHVPIAAVARGAKIIEKHFTIDKTFEGNDHTVSLLPDEFKAMVTQIREVEESIGTAAPREVSTGELMNRVNLAKSLVATRTIAKGEVVQAEDVEVKSPGRGLQPNYLPQLVGRTMARDVEAGSFFFEGDLKDDLVTRRDFKFDRPWGLPVRYHDFKPLISEAKPDFLEFHFSYKDLEIDIDDVFDRKLDMSFTTHLPDLFAGDFLVDLASRDQEIWERSIAEVQRTIDITRDLTRYFTVDDDPIMVTTMGGFTKDAHIPAAARAEKYERIGEALRRLDTSGVRLAAQTLPPYPWLMGGQQYHNLFLDPKDTAEFADTFDTALCLDISHTMLAANFLKMPLSEAVELLAPRTIHLHLVDGTGVDGEGVQVGEGDVDWASLGKQLRELSPTSSFIPEIWQGHVNNGEGFFTALDRLEKWL